jgi:hypothetical protein
LRGIKVYAIRRMGYEGVCFRCMFITQDFMKALLRLFKALLKALSRLFQALLFITQDFIKALLRLFKAVLKLFKGSIKAL